MSWQAVKTVLEKSTHSGTPKLVLVCIAEHYNEESKVAWPGIDKLASYCNVSRQSIFNAIDKLKEAGELEVLYKQGPNGVNLYKIPLLYNNLPSSTLDCGGNSYGNSQSSVLDGKENETVKLALLRQSSQLDGTVKPALPEPKEPKENRERENYTHTKKIDYADHVLGAMSNGVPPTDTPYPVEPFWRYRDEFLDTYARMFPNVILDEAKRGAIAELGAEEDSDPSKFERACRECSLNWSGKGPPPTQRVIDVYQAGGTYAEWRKRNYGDGNGPPPAPKEKVVFRDKRTGEIIT